MCAFDTYFEIKVSLGLQFCLEGSDRILGEFRVLTACYSNRGTGDKFIDQRFFLQDFHRTNYATVSHVRSFPFC